MTTKNNEIEKKKVLELIKDYKRFAKEHERIDEPLNALECLDNFEQDFKELI